MNSSPFELFINLVRFDQAIIKSIHDQGLLYDKLDLLQDEKDRFQQELDALKVFVYATQKTVHEKELEMKKLDERIDELKKKLDDLSNLKQYTPLKKELEHLQQEQIATEEGLIVAWNQLETAQRNVEQKKGLLSQKILDQDSLIKEVEDQIASIQKAIDLAKEKRPEMQKLVHQDWLEKYNAMHGRVENPVVEIVNGGSCGGCFYAISNQDIARLKNKALLQCNSCYRFMYDPSVLHINKQDIQDLVHVGQ